MTPASHKLRKSPRSERSKPNTHQPDEPAAEHSLLQLQRLAGNRAVVGLIESQEEQETVQRKPGSAALHSVTTPHIQRAPMGGESMTPETASEPTAATSGGLIVEDDAPGVAPGQMRKSEFLEQLRSTVCATADEALAEAGQSTAGCPYIEQWLSYYADQPPAHVERALRKYAPEANSATSARDYIPAVSNRVRQGIATWARTGELTGVPEELQSMFSGPGAALGAIGGMLGSIGSAIGGAIAAAAGAIGGAFSSIGKALFKRKEGSAAATDDPQSIQSQLRGGQPLDGGTTARMSTGFGMDFSNVRVHTNAEAAGLSDSLNARAFTVGSDIAFGAGEYQPGTLIGDALIAHELAHVAQQKNAASSGPLTKSTGDDGLLETEADDAAISLAAALHGGFSVRAPRSTSLATLQLQSCAHTPPQIRVPRGSWATPEQADQLLADDPVIYPRIKARVEKGKKASGHTHELGSEDYLSQATSVSGDEAKIENVSREMMHAGGFADVDSGEIYLHRKNADYMDVMRNGKITPLAVPPSAGPMTVVHEAVHLYGDKAWEARVGHGANEGTTEYFTRRVLSKQKNKEIEGGEAMFERQSYPDEFEAVKCLASEANDELLADAYFLGQIDPLRKKVGATEFDAWCTAMKGGDFAAAHAALGCKPPAKKPEE